MKGQYVRKRKDLVGQRFGRLTVVAERPISKRCGQWLCQCSCGKMIEVCTASLRRGHTKSCGCLHSDTTKELFTKHGSWGNPTYNSWHNMKQRCLTPTNIAYKDYGGRGISFCGEWETFENFFSAMGERPEGTTLERINTNGNYEPGNCSWITQREQTRNTRKTKLSHEIVSEMRRLRKQGVKMLDLAIKYGVDDSTVSRALGGKTWF